MGAEQAIPLKSHRTPLDTDSFREEAFALVRRYHDAGLTCGHTGIHNFEYHTHEKKRVLRLADARWVIAWEHCREPPALFRRCDWHPFTEVKARGLTSTNKTVVCELDAFDDALFQMANKFTVAAAWWYLRKFAHPLVVFNPVKSIMVMEPVVATLLCNRMDALSLPACDIWSQFPCSKDARTFLEFETVERALFFAFHKGRQHNREQNREAWKTEEKDGILFAFGDGIPFDTVDSMLATMQASTQ